MGEISALACHDSNRVQAVQEDFNRRIRVGDRYQAVISKNLQLTSQRSSGELLWSPSSTNGVCDANTFLTDIRKMFPSSMEVDEEAALMLLQSCNHDRLAALKMADLPKWIRSVKTVSAARPKNNHIVLNLDEDEHCLICKAGGTVLVCDVSDCGRLYHPACVGLGNIPSGKWKCPRHQCALCSEKSTKLQCSSCWISYCSKHAPFGSDSKQFKCINCTTRYEDDRKIFLEELQVLRSKNLENDNSCKLKLVVQGKPVDLWTLYHSVAALGGFDNVRNHDWARIYRHLGFRVAVRGSSYSDLAEIYLTQLLPYADSQSNRKP